MDMLQDAWGNIGPSCYRHSDVNVHKISGVFYLQVADRFFYRRSAPQYRSIGFSKIHLFDIYGFTFVFYNYSHYYEEVKKRRLFQFTSFIKNTYYNLMDYINVIKIYLFLMDYI